LRPLRSAAYLAWLRTLPCAICGRTPSEAAHTGPHALSRKASDFSAIPLCHQHHRTGNESYHHLSEKNFRALWRLDIPALARRLANAYRLRYPGRCAGAEEGGTESARAEDTEAEDTARR
jgi:hypothetical protein